MAHHQRNLNTRAAAAESSEDEAPRQACALPRKARETCPLDASGILDLLNSPARPGLTLRQCTFCDDDVMELRGLLASRLPFNLRNALLEFDRYLSRSETEESKTAIANSMSELTYRWLNGELFKRSHQPKPDSRAAMATARARKSPPRIQCKLDRNRRIRKKVIKEHADALLCEFCAAYAAYQDCLWDDPPGHDHDEPQDHPRAIMQKLIEDSATNLELRCAAWLESQGVHHWNEIRALGSESDNDVFYLTEDDVGDEQKQQFGRRKYTPDFVLIDRERRHVRVPIKLSRNGGAGSAHHRSLPFVTVLEVKGFVRLHGLTKGEPWAKVRRNVSRYTRHFGPCLLLQKHGMSRESADELAAHVPRCAVATLDLDRLPKLPHLSDPWTCARDDIEAVPDFLASCTYSANSELGDLQNLAAVEVRAVNMCRRLRLVHRRDGDCAPWRELVLKWLFGGWKARMVVRLCREHEEARQLAKQEAEAASDVESSNDGKEGEEFREQHADLDSWEALCKCVPVFLNCTSPRKPLIRVMCADHIARCGRLSEQSPASAAAAPAAAVAPAQPPLLPAVEPLAVDLGRLTLQADLDSEDSTEWEDRAFEWADQADAMLALKAKKLYRRAMSKKW